MNAAVSDQGLELETALAVALAELKTAKDKIAQLEALSDLGERLVDAGSFQMDWDAASDLRPVTEPDAAQPAKHRASPRCPSRPNGQNSNPESRSRRIKGRGNVTSYSKTWSFLTIRRFMARKGLFSYQLQATLPPTGVSLSR